MSQNVLQISHMSKPEITKSDLSISSFSGKCHTFTLLKHTESDVHKWKHSDKKKRHVTNENIDWNTCTTNGEGLNE